MGKIVKPHLLTFSSPGYDSPQRFINQASESSFFQSISVYSDEHVSELKKSRPIFFRLWKRRGYGFWIWKPRLILTALNATPEGEYLVYLDQGFHIQKSGAKRLQQYIELLESSGSLIGVFSAGENYRPEFFVRQQAVKRHNPEFYNSGFGDYIYAGILIIKNVEASRGAINEWKEMCEETPLLAPLPIRFFQRRDFIGQDGDNGYLPVVLSKLGRFFKFPTGEINLMNHEGFQLHHVLPSEDHNNFDWSHLSDRPFLAKRDR
jgi:hypothetical protein